MFTIIEPNLTHMIQKARKFPFKVLEMTVIQVADHNFEYSVFENGRKLCSKVLGPGGFIACFVCKNYRNYPYVCVHFFTRIPRIGYEEPSANPYALGLLSGVEITEQAILEHPHIVQHFLKDSWLTLVNK